jgi:hypothetical protein
MRAILIVKMTTIGHINTSAATVRGEATNALVNLNFELNVFTKRLVQPPPEYVDVGQHLAPKRRQEAQGGVRHAIARKLGLLFKDASLIPRTPHLIKAYGLRASEIARSSAANPRGDNSHGAFAGMIGADGTTLWAAATSGWSSIQCHLLACLLARIWDPSEAASIWVEIVDTRKTYLRARLAEEGELEHEVMCAVEGDITRSDLRDWDASARAWLRVADSIMAKQQTQVRLIVDNLDLPVNGKFDTYESVLDAWTSSMSQMEKLLAGVPLQVHRGDILLGLLSWHLYPDLKYLSKNEQDISSVTPFLRDAGFLPLGWNLLPGLRRTTEQSTGPFL